MSGVQSLPSWEITVQEFAQQFTSAMSYLLYTIDSTVADLARIVYITLLVVGVLLYYTHAAQRLGKDLIKGGVALAIISEFLYPLLIRP
ncbi:MAG: hypothetical protein JRN06_08925 [Nitrososphaerota archaeon]|nr:hypothetical protein [Nitrososphaerota archaeon]MDG7024573.1 hypothetical protein [Nitrososphaerota archaeon]